MSNCLRDASIAFDIGANVGSWSVLMGKLGPSCKIFSFEPIPQTFDILRANIALNAPTAITAVHSAVSDENSVLDFEVPGNAAIFGRLAPRQTGSVDDGRFHKAAIIKVKCSRLDSFCATNGISEINFIKMDVEGFELSALKGLGALFTNKKVKALHMETIRENHERAGESFESLLRFVKDCGYSFYLLNDAGEPLQKVPIDSIRADNHVCIPD